MSRPLTKAERERILGMEWATFSAGAALRDYEATVADLEQRLAVAMDTLRAIDGIVVFRSESHARDVYFMVRDALSRIGAGKEGE